MTQLILVALVLGGAGAAIYFGVRLAKAEGRLKQADDANQALKRMNQALAKAAKHDKNIQDWIRRVEHGSVSERNDVYAEIIGHKTDDS